MTQCPPRLGGETIHMLQEFSLDNQSEMDQWDAYVNSHPVGTPYHLSHWIRTLQETYSFKPVMYVNKNEKDVIKGILPCFLIKTFLTGSRLVSLPFSDYGGPLFSDETEERELLDLLIDKYKNKMKYLEMRGPLQENSSFVSQNYYKRHFLKLNDDLAQLRKKLDKRTIRYSIRKAERLGVEIKEENNQDGMDEFYRLNAMTRRKHGVPSQPRKYFKNVLRHVISNGCGFILTAVYNSETIGASVFLKSNKTIHYKYNASDPEYLKKVSPNHTLTWHAIRKGHDEGYDYLDFGRTSPDNEGLIRYKRMWGTQELEVPYYYYPEIRGVSSTEESSWAYQKFTSAWRFLPDKVAERLGSVLYKYTA